MEEHDNKAKAAAVALTLASNGADRELLAALHDAIINEHRYIQGTLIAMLCRLLYRIGKENTGKDGRNQHSIEMCESLVRISDGTYSPSDIEMLRRFFF